MANSLPFYTNHPLTSKVIYRDMVLTGTLTGTPTTFSEYQRTLTNKNPLKNTWRERPWTPKNKPGRISPSICHQWLSYCPLQTFGTRWDAALATSTPVSLQECNKLKRASMAHSTLPLSFSLQTILISKHHQWRMTNWHVPSRNVKWPIMEINK